VNLTDGLDGLATGCMLLVAAVFAIIAFVSNHYIVADYLNILYIEGAGQIAIFLSSMIGALLGFLWFNSYPAQLFMGDTGSLALGGSMALAAILLRRECLFAIVGGIFVLETLSVILQVFWVRCFKKRLFLCSPIHHHFQIKGWHESKIVIRFWMIGLILALIGLLSLKIQ
jgi:phospho-N-acetylmuramoyl-pentapeptide-transferase